MLGSLSNLGRRKIVLIRVREPLLAAGNQVCQLLEDDLVNLFRVVRLCLLAMLLLISHKVVQLIVFLSAVHLISELIAHFVQHAINLNEGLLVVGSGLDQVFRKLLARFDERAVANVALPAAEDLTDQVVLEEIH